jgi:hypothetical protein
MSAGYTYGFKGSSDISQIAEVVCQQWFIDGGCRENRAFNAAAFSPFAAEQMVNGLVQTCNDAIEDFERESASS